MTPSTLKRIRTTLGMTQRDMARFLGLKEGGDRSVRMWEAGDRIPSGPVILIYELIRDGVILPEHRDNWDE